METTKDMQMQAKRRTAAGDNDNKPLKLTKAQLAKAKSRAAILIDPDQVSVTYKTCARILDVSVESIKKYVASGALKPFVLKGHKLAIGVDVRSIVNCYGEGGAK